MKTWLISSLGEESIQGGETIQGEETIQGRKLYEEIRYILLELPFKLLRLNSTISIPDYNIGR